ncbi:hypothetical protein G9U51_04025 [Calidifontibacter sp. DB0510]|uniref:Uncharacterized protein n=1 Tax=Metallococcus carri TaxID=1656884 RepID=A0A967AYA1_9MICO|nr:hypothetical protein [Metallococcus carri]NHN54953.1 hypothetical protein [Metallococcus carri]NOP37299.1 hypothetical protein [Calidifontibacter sp. DB2511S]
MTTENQAGKKTAYNVGAGIIGALLALFAIFGLIAQQGAITQPQTYKAQISYDQ